MIYVIEYDNFCENRLCTEFGYFTNESDAEHFVNKLDKSEDYYVRELSKHEE